MLIKVGKPWIAVDLDDTSIEYTPALIRWHNSVYPNKIALDDFKGPYIEDFARTFRCDVKEARRRLTVFSRSYYFRGAKPINGAHEALTQLSADFNLAGVTSREEGLETFTHKQVEALFPRVFSMLEFSQNHYLTQSNRRTKADICCSLPDLRVFAEDSPDYSTQSADRGIQVYMIDWPFNRMVAHRNIVRFPNETYWEDFTNEIYKAE